MQPDRPRWSQESQPMRYYLYISETKVDMLFPQVPGAVQQGIAKKVGFDLKLFTASVETQNQTFESRIARLQAVEEHLRLAGKIGSPGDQTPWIAGTVMAHFVPIVDNAVLFLSQLNEGYLVLGGSTEHMIGSVKSGIRGLSFSSFYQISRILSQLYEQEKQGYDYIGKIDYSDHLYKLDGNLDWLFKRELRDPPQRVEFLAKRLASVGTPREGGTSTIATPLYVALAE